MKTLWFVGLVVILLPAVVFFAGQFGMLKGKAPGDLGVHNGRLKPPSNTPNSVSSQAGLYPEHPQRGYADIASPALPRRRRVCAAQASRYCPRFASDDV